MFSWPDRETILIETLVKGLPSSYEVEHLVRIFYADAPVRKNCSTKGNLVYVRAGRSRLVAALRVNGCCFIEKKRLADAATTKNNIKEIVFILSRMLYGLLCRQTGLRPPWGMLTGVRPVSLLRKSIAQGTREAAKQKLIEGYGISSQKYALISSIEKRQTPWLTSCRPKSYSLYISIPFCPSRCSYCSFVSRTIAKEADLVDPYLQKLGQELAQTASLARRCGLQLETIYIGGGTPTALSARQLETLLLNVERYFDVKGVREYTAEAGRPDCTDIEKLALLKKYGISRISINPQTMSDKVLRRIGRRHSAQDVRYCFAEARTAGHQNVNMDLIAGLPDDTAQGFIATLEEIVALAPENITLHTLTLKRSSDYVIDKQTGVSSPSEMLEAAYPRLVQAGYAPYYLYRQKSTVENLENTGWTKPGKEGLYNIFIMEEQHSILAVGAGASTKLVAQNGKRIQRMYNHKFPLEYISHFEQVLDKKRGVSEFYAGNLDTKTFG